MIDLLAFGNMGGWLAMRSTDLKFLEESPTWATLRGPRLHPQQVMPGSSASTLETVTLRIHDQPEVRLRRAVDDHIDFVARMLRHLGVRERDVDDAVQQVFMALSTRLADIELGHEQRFLYGAARNIAKHAWRARAKELELGSELEIVDPGPSPHELIEEQQRLATFHRIVDRLPSRLREVFLLAEVEELSAPSIAAMLNVPQGTVASRLRRAREAFAIAARAVLEVQS